jgi:putative nucleotidyltransferase with HDIG domain
MLVTSAVVTCLLLAALLTPGLFGLGPAGFAGGVPRPGEIADRSYKAPADITIPDRQATEELRRAAIEQAPVVYDYDERRSTTAREQIRQAFLAGREAAARTPEEGGGDPLAAFRQALPDERGELPRESIELLTDRAFSIEDERGLLRLVGQGSTPMILDDKAELERHAEKRVVVVREIGSGTERPLGPDDRVFSLDEARAKARNAAESVLGDRFPGERRELVALAEALILPNVNFNLRATDERRQAAESGVKEVTITLRKGEIIVRDGDPITERHVWILEGLHEKQLTMNRISAFVGIGVLLLALFLVFWRFGSAAFARFGREPRDALFLTLVMACTAIGLRVSVFLADAVAERVEELPFLPQNPDAYYWAIPVAAATMLVRLVQGAETTLLFAALVSLISAFAMGGRVEYAIFTLAGSLAAAGGVARVTQRGTVLRAGIRVGLVNFVVVGAILMLKGRLDPGPLALTMGLGFIGGALAGVLVTGLAPLVETLFAYTTDIKLLELANRDQKLLRELEITAPGTYHHSMMVGHLAERAAEAIGANALLARVCAYYHDVGKMKRPHFFIENVTMHSAENRHDKISPSMSARIIQAHVKDGLEYGRDHSLVPPIMEGIAQHHGTSLVRFFFEKAREQSDPEKGGMVEEHDYRYPGPKPQTREAGILMLADSVEAASRTLTDTSRPRIQQLVQRIINNYFRDGQLDECNLTLRDLHRIARSFIDTLSAIRHERIDYPEIPEVVEERKAQEVPDEGVVERLEPRSKDRPERTSEGRGGDIRRLGLP